MPIHDRIERTIANGIIQELLAKGWSVSVLDEEEVALLRCTSRTDILDAMGETDTSSLIAHDSTGKRLGWIWFVHGNGTDVVADYSGDGPVYELMNQLTEHMNP